MPVPARTQLTRRAIRSSRAALLWLLLPVISLLAACDTLNSATPTPLPVATATAAASPTPVATATPQVTPTEVAEQTGPTQLPEATTQPQGSNGGVVETSPTEVAQNSTTPTPLALVPAPSAVVQLLPVSQREQIFNKVWQTVNDKYLYRDFRGVDWNAVRTEYEPKIKAAASAQAFYELIAEMIHKLNDDHSRYYSPWQAAEEDKQAGNNNNYVGVGILSSYGDTSILVQEVFPNSPAADAGLKRRDQILAVDGVPVRKEDSSNSRIRGAAGSQVRLTVQSPGEAPRDVTLTRRSVLGKIVPTASRLVQDPDIGYLVIPTLSVEDMDKGVENALSSLLDSSTPLKGLVMDLRGNSGGFEYVMQHIAGEFVTGRVGAHFTQSSSEPMVIDKGKLYDRLKSMPLVILVDKGTESAAEWLSGALQSTERARVVGETSAGNTEEIFQYNFDDKSRLWLAQRGFRLNDGTNLEGRGVIPDVPLAEEWTNFSDDNDPQIKKAVDLLHGGTSAARLSQTPSTAGAMQGANVAN